MLMAVALAATMTMTMTIMMMMSLISKHYVYIAFWVNPFNYTFI